MSNTYWVLRWHRTDTGEIDTSWGGAYWEERAGACLMTRAARFRSASEARAAVGPSVLDRKTGTSHLRVVRVTRKPGPLRRRIAELEAVVLRQKGEIVFAQNQEEIAKSVAREAGANRERIAELESRLACAEELERRHVREWHDSIVRHEQQRDEEARMRDALESRAEKAEARVAELETALREALEYCTVLRDECVVCNGRGLSDGTLYRIGDCRECSGKGFTETDRAVRLRAVLEGKR